MILYTINNIFPDKSFAFTITASDLHLSPAVHTHTIANIVANTDPQNPEPTCSAALALKASSTHTHTMVRELYTQEMQDPEEYEGGAFVVGATVTAGSVTPSVAVSGGTTLTIGYVSAQTNNIGGLLDQNPVTTNPILEVWTGSRWDLSGDMGSLVIEENTND